MVHPYPTSNRSEHTMANRYIRCGVAYPGPRLGTFASARRGVTNPLRSLGLL